jgi:PAS domain S-box-containing protein
VRRYFPSVLKGRNMSETPRSISFASLENSIPQASLESILCTEELQRRPSRPRDYERDNQALVKLVSALADSPSTILQVLAETILDIAQCDSAGLSLLTRDGKTPDLRGHRFYWPAIAGMWNPHVGGGTPRNFGPCGDVLDQNRTLLFRHFERRYPYLLPVIPAAEECLLVPFYVDSKAVGTIWAIMHSDRRKFDAEDDRVMASLGKFASSAYQARAHIEGLKIQMAEREKAEAELRELTDGLEGQVRARTAELQRSEERLRLAQQAARLGTFEWNIQTAVNTWTPELEEMYGLPPGGFRGTQTAFENLVYPDDRAAVIALVNWALKTGLPARGEWRVVWADASVHWIAGHWQVFMNESGEPSRMIGVNADVTERKLAEQALTEMTRKLIEAQEQERARIGRELHDDVNQRLAVLSLQLEELKQNPSEVEDRVQDLRNRLSEISDDVQALSHDLHSSKLEYLGVVAGMKSWCKEFAERQKMEIAFKSDACNALLPDVGRILFRVLQEALHNATKHSGVKKIDVQLHEESGQTHLIVSDSGKGFDVEAAEQGNGLGLTSMRERVRLVNGTITIDSKPMGGTTIHVRVPSRSENLSKQAVG